jgi:hypothetical protein
MTQEYTLVSPDSFACLKRGVSPPRFRPAPFPGDRHPWAQSNLIPATLPSPCAHRRRSHPSGFDGNSTRLPLSDLRAHRGKELLAEHSPNPHNPGSCELCVSLPQSLETEPHRQLGFLPCLSVKRLRSASTLLPSFPSVQFRNPHGRPVNPRLFNIIQFSNCPSICVHLRTLSSRPFVRFVPFGSTSEPIEIDRFSRTVPCKLRNKLLLARSIRR